MEMHHTTRQMVSSLTSSSISSSRQTRTLLSVRSGERAHKTGINELFYEMGLRLPSHAQRTERRRANELRSQEMALEARATSFPPTPSPPSPPTGTTPSATFPPLPPLHCRWPSSRPDPRSTAALASRPPLRGGRRVRHLRRHFCRWCKLFHVDASSRWRRGRRWKEGRREEADPTRALPSRASLLFAPFPFHTQRLHAEQSAVRTAPLAGPGRRRWWRARALRGVGRAAVRRRRGCLVAAPRKTKKRSFFLRDPSSVVCFSPVCEDRPRQRELPPERATGQMSRRSH